MANIGNFGVIGVRSAKFVQDGKLVEELRHLKVATVENTGDTNYMTGGENNPRLLTISSNQASSITLEHSGSSPRIMAMQTGQGEAIVGTKAVTIEEDLKISTGKVTLTNEVIGEKLIGVMIGGEILKEATATPTKGQYKFDKTTKAVTFESTQTGIAHVIYKANQETTSVVKTAKNDTMDYDITLDLILKDVNTKKVFLGQYHAPSGKLDLNNSTSGNNNGGEPDAVTMKFDLSEVQEVGYTWCLDIFPDTKQG